MSETDKASFDAMRAQNEKLMRKLEKIKNKMVQIQDLSTQKISNMQEEITKKAEKESLEQSQKQFFDKMMSMESDQDKNLTRLVQDQLQKLSEQIETNAALVDKRIGSIGKEINVDRLMKLIDKKMSKEEGQMKIDMVEQKVNRAEKLIKNCDGNFNRFQVSCFYLK